MKLKKENELEKNCEIESSKKDDESERKKESEQEKKKKKKVFMLRRVMSRVFFKQTNLYLNSCTKRHVIQMNLMNICLVLLSLCCRNMRTCFLTMCLVDCHILEE